MESKFKQCIMLTGAGARISQEVAIIDQLIQRKGLIIDQQDTMLAGFSSGGLNLMAINGCFRSENPMPWNDYYKEEILWPLTTANVYTPSKVKPPIFDTAPLRNLLNTVLDAMGFQWMGDLPFDSYVLTYSERQFATKWANNFLFNTTNNRSLNCSDLFMASASIPIVFGHQEIGNKAGEPRNFPGGKFNDGGTIGQFKRFGEHIGLYIHDHEPFETIHIISPMRQAPDESELNSLDEHQGILKKFSANMLFKAFYKFLEEVQEWQEANGPLANEVLVSIPRMSETFPMLKFDEQKKQYEKTSEWFDANPDQLAVPLKAFLDTHQV